MRNLQYIKSLFKDIGCLLLCLLLLNDFLLIEKYSSLEVKAYEANSIYFGNGSWMHVDTFAGKDSTTISNFAINLKKANLNSVFILAKDINGLVTFPSKNALAIKYEKDFMDEIINALNKEKINVYFYFVVNTDPTWLKVHPEDITYQAGIAGNKTPIPHPEKKLVNLTSKAYMNYLSLIIREAISKYKIKGVQLDYIRYSNCIYGFSKEELRLAKEKNIDVEKIIDLTYKTFVSPGDWQTIFKRYDDGDKDVLKWALLREEIVFNFVNYISQIVHKEGKEFGTTLVSSGAFDSSYSIHFGQSYSMISSIADFVTPMAYHGERNNVYDWVNSVCEGVRKKVKSSCKVAIGIQANSTSTEKMNEAINALQKFGYGFILFRVGTYCLGFYDLIYRDNLHSEIYLNVYNLIPDSPIKGISLKRIGGAFNPVKDSKFNWIVENSFFKFYSIRCLTLPLSESNFYINSTVNFNSVSNSFSPYIVCSDEKKDFPTFSTSLFSLLSIDIIPKEKKLLINGENKPFSNIKVINGTTFINASILKEVFNCKESPDLLNGSITLKSDKKEMKLSSKDKIVHYKLEEKLFTSSADSENLLIEDKLFYIPLRRTLQFFEFLITYNSQTKEIHCFKIERCPNVVLFSFLKEISDNFLFLSGAKRIYISINDFLNGQYLYLLYDMHTKGREVFIICNLAENSDFSYFEILFDLININEPSILTLDGLSYYLPSSSRVSLKEIGKRELFIEFSKNYELKDFKGILNIILRQGSELKFDSAHNYYLLIDRQTLPYKFILKSLTNLSLLYQPSNFQF